jgi:hypothetical protein
VNVTVILVNIDGVCGVDLEGDGDAGADVLLVMSRRRFCRGNGVWRDIDFINIGNERHFPMQPWFQRVLGWGAKHRENADIAGIYLIKRGNEPEQDQQDQDCRTQGNCFRTERPARLAKRALDELRHCDPLDVVYSLT